MELCGKSNSQNYSVTTGEQLHNALGTTYK
jgi:hypothetical protein